MVTTIQGQCALKKSAAHSNGFNGRWIGNTRRKNDSHQPQRGFAASGTRRHAPCEQPDCSTRCGSPFSNPNTLLNTRANISTKLCGRLSQSRHVSCVESERCAFGWKTLGSPMPPRLGANTLPYGRHEQLRSESDETCYLCNAYQRHRLSAARVNLDLPGIQPAAAVPS